MGGAGGSSDFGSVGRPRGGGGGGGGGSGRKGKSEDSFDCEAYSATVTLKSPKKSVVAKIRKGERLLVELGDDDSVLVKTKDDETAGSIVVTEQEDLVECLKSGTKYEALVLSKESGACVVELSAE